MKKLTQGILCLLMATSLVACSSSSSSSSSSATSSTDGTVTDGTYTSTQVGYNEKNVVVEVTVKDGALSEITIDESDNNQQMASDDDRADLASRMVEANSYDVDGISGATMTSNAVKEAVKDCMTQAGFTFEEETTATKGEDETAECDVLIIGLGASGTLAAISAAENGATVIGVEATGAIGGMGNAAQGMFAINTKEQKERYTEEELAEYNEEFWYNEIISESRHMGNAALITKDINESANTVQYLQDHGVAMYLSETPQMIGHFDQIVEYHRWNNTEPFVHLQASMEDLGVDMRINTTATSLTTDDTGVVTGAVCTKEDGSTLTITAKATIVSTGSFAGNEELMREVLTDAVYDNCQVIPAQDLPGIDMMWNVGAAKGQLLPMAHGVTTTVTLEVADQLTLNTPILWVNNLGKRFMSSSDLKETTNFTTDVVAQGGVAYTIVDEATVQRWSDDSYENTGTWVHYWDHTGILDENGEHTIYHATIDYDTFQSDFELLEEAGEGIKVDTLEEVAEYLGCDLDDLQATVDSYNTAVETKNDTEFHTDSEDLVYTVKEGPYYVTKGHAGILVALGGVNTSDELEVLDENHNIIPGLYATGNNVSGISDFVYSTIEGIGLGFSLTSGRLAGQYATEYALSK